MNRMLIKKALLPAGLIAFVFSLGCATPQPMRSIGGYSFSAGEKAASTALAQIGRPYKYKGDTPSGFDCSGLVRYSYLTAGMNLPHGTSALREISHPVSTRDIHQGDLVFFNQRGKKYSHVGVFVGGSQFVHAPSTGKTVRKDSLDDPYWEKHFLGARRF